MQDLNQPRNFQVSHFWGLRRVSETQRGQRESGWAEFERWLENDPRLCPLLPPAPLLVEIPAPAHHGGPRGQEAPGEDGGESLGAEWQRGTDR